MMLILFLAALTDPAYDLTRYEIFNHNHVQFFRLPRLSGLLIQDKLGHKLLVVDEKTGAVRHRLDAAGQGPGELDMPVVLGVRDDHFIVCMLDGRVMAFDFRLRLREDVAYRKLAMNVLGGQYFGGKFWLWLIPTEGFFLAEASLNGPRWRVHRKLFPSEMDDKFRTAYGFGYQTGVVYKRRCRPGDDSYLVEAYDYPFKEPAMMLARPVEHLPLFERSRVYINSCFRTPTGYYVSIVFADARYRTTGSWIDEWTANGTFVKRHTVPLDTSLVAVQHTDRMLAYSMDDVLYWDIADFLKNL